MTHRRLMKLHGAASALLLIGLLAAPAAADDTNTQGEVELGAIWFVESDPGDSAKFEEYRDVPSGLTLEHAVIDWWNDGQWHLDFEGTDLVQDDQRLDLRFGKLDLFKLTVGWDENTRRYGEQANQLWTHQGGGVFTLDDTLQSAIEAAGASVDLDDDGAWDDGTKGAIIRDAILDSAGIVDLGYRRRTGDMALEFTPDDHWRFGFSGQRERRTGSVPQSLGAYFFGSNSYSEVAAPIDYRTDTFSGWVEYRRKRWNAGARYTVSDFKTEYDALSWDNLLFLNDTPAGGSDVEPGVNQMSLGADNESEQLVLWFGANLPGSTRIYATMSQSTVEQDDPFLPMSSNALLGVNPLIVNNYDGQHEYDHWSVKISSHPLPWLGLRGWFRQYDFDDNSPIYDFVNYAEVDRSVGPSRRNLPYSFDRTSFGVGPTFAPTDWVRFGLSWEHEQVDRVHAAVEDTDEDTFEATLDIDVTEKLFLRASAATANRDSSHFDAEWHEESFPAGESIAYAINEGHREFFWADRDQDELKLMLEYTPVSTVSLFLEAGYLANDYSDPNSGRDIGTTLEVLEDRNGDGVLDEIDLLLAGREQDRTESLTIGFTWSPKDNVAIYGDHTWEREKWEMASRYRGVSLNAGTDSLLDDWFTDVVDRYQTTTLGLDWKWADGTWRLVADFAHSRGKGDIYTAYVEGGSASGNTDLIEFPQLDTEFWLADLHLTREIEGGWTIGLRYWWEAWESDDWQTDYMRPYMGRPVQDPASANSAFLGVDFADYDNHVLMLTAKYEF